MPLTIGGCPLRIIGDAVRERDETFYVNLSNPSGNTEIGDGQAVGTIQNDDFWPNAARLWQLFP